MSGLHYISIILALLMGGCPTHLAKVCPRCVAVHPDRAPPIAAGTRSVFVLVPGILGYEWEWNGVQIMLAQVPAAEVLVADWDPWQSLSKGAERVRAAAQRILDAMPATVREVVIIGHSAGGMAAALCASMLRVPQEVRVRVITVGTPFAGTRVSVVESHNQFHTPSFFAVGGTFDRWPAPAERVELEIYPTSWPNDPVMRPRFGHDPSSPSVLPPRTRFRRLPDGIDHNVALTWVAERLLAERHGAQASK